MDVEGLAILYNGMAGIMPALRTAAQLHSLAQYVNNLALAFVTPLRS